MSATPATAPNVAPTVPPVDSPPLGRLEGVSVAVEVAVDVAKVVGVEVMDTGEADADAEEVNVDEIVEVKGLVLVVP